MNRSSSPTSSTLITATGQEVVQRKAVKVLPARRQPQAGGILRNLVRLSIGATLLTAETVANQLRQAETKLRREPPPGPSQPEYELIEVVDRRTFLTDQPDRLARYALLGLIFECDAHLKYARTRLRQARQKADGIMSWLLRPVRTSKTLAPVRRGYQPVIARGRAEVNRLAEIGRAEEAYSRALAQTTLDQIFENFLDQATQNPRIQDFIQEFVQEQSLSLADEAIEELRERTVTGDILLERFVRSLLRRPRGEASTRANFSD